MEIFSVTFDKLSTYVGCIFMFYASYVFISASKRNILPEYQTLLIQQKILCHSKQRLPLYNRPSQRQIASGRSHDFTVALSYLCAMIAT